MLEALAAQFQNAADEVDAIPYSGDLPWQQWSHAMHLGPLSLGLGQGAFHLTALALRQDDTAAAEAAWAAAQLPLCSTLAARIADPDLAPAERVESARVLLGVLDHFKP